MTALTDDLIVKVVSEIHDPVTTTDELIPSGETSSFRSNPLGLAEFTLSRKDPAYVGLSLIHIFSGLALECFKRSQNSATSRRFSRMRLAVICP